MATAAGTIFRLEMKAIAQNHLRYQVVGRARKTDTEAKLDFPLRSDSNQLRGRSGAVVAKPRLTRSPVHRTDRTVILQTPGNFRREIVTEF
jgi:hypothetical protein